MSSKITLAMMLMCGFRVLSHAQQGLEKLSTMSVEDLLNIQVTSVSKTEQNLLKNDHLEYIDSTGSVASTLMKRGAYAKMRWLL